MSIGAGRPKFRIWLTMSAGWKKKVSCGNSLRQFAAQCLACNPTVERRWSGLSDDQDFAVRRTDGRLSLNARLMPLERQADVVAGPTRSHSRGMISRIAASTVVKNLLGFFDARAGRRAHVQPELAGIDRREEILADQGQHQNNRAAQERSRTRPRPSGDGAAPSPASTR